MLDASRQHGLPITIWPTDNPWPDEQHAHGVAFETDAGIALSVKYTFGRGKRPTVTFRAWRDRDFPDAELNAMLDAMWESGEAIELLRVERTGLWASPVCLDGHRYFRLQWGRASEAYLREQEKRAAESPAAL